MLIALRRVSGELAADGFPLSHSLQPVIDLEFGLFVMLGQPLRTGAIMRQIKQNSLCNMLNKVKNMEGPEPNDDSWTGAPRLAPGSRIATLIGGG